ncbi:hypothetical protein FIBSPDRAFT_201909 [Athelia psychrophila]|uniref:Uncharacterized protein n=1 Tax=Athelia psychrophila TaxID=1759441 RepID=A0A165ZIK0_9AGAM|nr:hypothetical protein FIBSPDRAFT_201909 [Fibularhizoctonia sp. CBS 109695]
MSSESPAPRKPRTMISGASSVACAGSGVSDTIVIMGYLHVLSFFPPSHFSSSHQIGCRFYCTHTTLSSG